MLAYLEKKFAPLTNVCAVKAYKRIQKTEGLSGYQLTVSRGGFSTSGWS